MRSRTLVVIGLLPALFVVGCGHARAPDIRSEELPAAERGKLGALEHAAKVAETHVEGAARTEKEAERAEHMADQEVDMAKDRLTEAQRALEGARAQGELNKLSAAQQQVDTASRVVESAEAKEKYVDKVQDLRAAEVKEAEALRDATRADLERERVQAAKRLGRAADVEERPFIVAQRETRRALVDQQRRILGISVEVEALKKNYEGKQRALEEALPKGHEERPGTPREREPSEESD